MDSGAGSETISLDLRSLLPPRQNKDGVFLRLYLETMCHCVDLQAFALEYVVPHCYIAATVLYMEGTLSWFIVLNPNIWCT
jgi:hypothetical protein